MENKTHYTPGEELAFAIDGALYLLEKANEMTSSLMALASLLEGKETLDSAQINGVSTMLDSIAMFYDGEVTEHNDSIKTMEVWKDEQLALSKARYHARKAV